MNEKYILKKLKTDRENLVFYSISVIPLLHLDDVYTVHN
jgi:hypothetical protein